MMGEREELKIKKEIVSWWFPEMVRLTGAVARRILERYEPCEMGKR